MNPEAHSLCPIFALVQKKNIFRINGEPLGFRYAIAELVNPGPYPTIFDHLASHQLASNLDRRTLPRPGMHCISDTRTYRIPAPSNEHSIAPVSVQQLTKD